MEVVISGVITNVLPLQQGVSQKSGNQWAKQEYVLRHEDGQYPRHCCFSVFGLDKIQQMNIQMGETLSVHLNIDARDYNGRWFNSLDAWKVERPQAQQAAPQPQAAPQQFPPQVNQQGYAQPAPAPAPQPQAAPQGNAQQGDLPF